MLRVFYIGNDKWAEQLVNLMVKAKNKIEICGVLVPKESKILKKFCLDNKIDQILMNNVNEAITDIKTLKPDLMVVIGHPFLLRQAVLSICPAIGFHPSLLPERRGRAPLNWAIIDGLKKSGVTIFLIDKGIDSGKIIVQKKFKIETDDTALDLINKVNKILKKILIEVIEQYPKFQLKKQNQSKVSYTPKRTFHDSEISLDMRAKRIERTVRALTGPYPSAFITNKFGEKIYLNKVSLTDE
jgi:methionyl-tRNA formyltransferase